MNQSFLNNELGQFVVKPSLPYESAVHFMRHPFLHCTDFCTFSPCPRTPPINIVCTSHSKRVDKFIVKSNITFNKLQDFETGYQTPEYFPHKECETSMLLLENKYHFSANVVFTKLPLQELLLAFGIFFMQR